MTLSPEAPERVHRLGLANLEGDRAGHGGKRDPVAGDDDIGAATGECGVGHQLEAGGVHAVAQSRGLAHLPGDGAGTRRRGLHGGPGGFTGGGVEIAFGPDEPGACDDHEHDGKDHRGEDYELEGGLATLAEATHGVTGPAVAEAATVTEPMPTARRNHVGWARCRVTVKLPALGAAVALQAGQVVDT